MIIWRISTARGYANVVRAIKLCNYIKCVHRSVFKSYLQISHCISNCIYIAVRVIIPSRYNIINYYNVFFLVFYFALHSQLEWWSQIPYRPRSPTSRLFTSAIFIYLFIIHLSDYPSIYYSVFLSHSYTLFSITTLTTSESSLLITYMRPNHFSLLSLSFSCSIYATPTFPLVC